VRPYTALATDSALARQPSADSSGRFRSAQAASSLLAQSSDRPAAKAQQANCNSARLRLPGLTRVRQRVIGDIMLADLSPAACRSALGRRSEGLGAQEEHLLPQRRLALEAGQFAGR